jgi:hypothetical protein
MQVVSLVTGDAFLSGYNITVDTTDFLKYLRKLTWEWNQGNLMHEMGFDDSFGMYFAEIIGYSGYCYNFNMLFSHDLFHLQQ